MKTGVMTIVTCLVLIISTFAAADDQEDLAKESQNPIGNIISLPLKTILILAWGLRMRFFIH